MRLLLNIISMIFLKREAVYGGRGWEITQILHFLKFTRIISLINPLIINDSLYGYTLFWIFNQHFSY